MKILKKALVVAGLAVALQGYVQAQSASQKYEPNWDSLKNIKVPEWWLDAKFGIYFHWGPYNVPAYDTEWYSHWMYNEGNKIRKYHEKYYGTLDKFGYKDFIPMFKGEKFDAVKLAKLFKKAGARFAGPCAEHADGFAMWDSALTEWDAKDMGPKRDIVGEMEKAVKAQGLKFITTYHRHWLHSWYPTWDKTVDAGDPKYAGLYGPYAPKGNFEAWGLTKDLSNFTYPDDKFNQEWLDRLNELMSKYEPDVIWFDNKMNIIGEKYRQEFLANYYNQGEKLKQEVVCTYKAQDMAEGTAVLDLERSRMSQKTEFPWLTDDSIDWKAWSYIENPRYKTTNRIIDFLVDVVSKNGAVLLNVTPRTDGSIPTEVENKLLEIGRWLEINGEAIYETRPWKIYGEGPQRIVEGHLSEDKNKDAVAEDIRFTTKGDNLYAITLGWFDGDVVIKSLKKDSDLLDKNIKRVSLLGSDEKLRWEQTEEGLIIKNPKKPDVEHAFAFKVELK